MNASKFQMKTPIWNWIAVVAITPGVLLLIILTSPLLAVFVAYDLVFLGWGRASEDRRRD